MNTVFIMRHGDAQRGVPDHARPLTEVGEEEVVSAIRHLGELRWIAASPLRRAQESAALVLAQRTAPIETWRELVPGGTPEAVYGKLRDSTGPGLVVSHLPLVAVLIGELTGAMPQMSTGTVARVSGEAFLPGWCELDWVK